MNTYKEVKQQVITECKARNNGETPCKDKFFILEPCEDGINIIDCPCKRILELRARYFRAGINEKYWNFEWNNIQNDFDANLLNKIKVIKDNILYVVENKRSIILTGGYGSGKTTVGSLLLKEYINKTTPDFKNEFNAYYVRATDLIDVWFKTDKDEEEEMIELYEKYKNCSMLVIDEIDKLYSEKIIEMFSDLLAKFIDKKSLILISNISVEEMKNKKYSKHLISRIEYLDNFEFKNGNYRKYKSTLIEELKTKGV